MIIKIIIINLIKKNSLLMYNSKTSIKKYEITNAVINLFFMSFYYYGKAIKHFL